MQQTGHPSIHPSTADLHQERTGWRRRRGGAHHQGDATDMDEGVSDQSQGRGQIKVRLRGTTLFGLRAGAVRLRSALPSLFVTTASGAEAFQEENRGEDRSEVSRSFVVQSQKSTPTDAAHRIGQCFESCRCCACGPVAAAWLPGFGPKCKTRERGMGFSYRARSGRRKRKEEMNPKCNPASISICQRWIGAR